MSLLKVEQRELIDYQLRLPGFEGPLDVLLRLIERQQMPVTDISLVAVTDQFLAHTRKMGGAPPDVIAEFATVGTRLVQLKSRALLPRPQVEHEDETPGDLIVQLMEYKAMKDAALQLGRLDADGFRSFVRGEGAVALPAQPAEPNLAQHHPHVLARALRRRLTIVPWPTQIVKQLRAVSMHELASSMISKLRRGSTSFSELTKDSESDHDTRTGFLALLVLVRRRVVEAQQTEPFGPIQVTLLPGRNSDVWSKHAMQEFGE